CFSLGDSLDRLVHVGAHRDLRNVYVAVGHCNLGEILLAYRLARSRELRNLSDVRSLRSLSAGVRVDLGVEYHDVHVLARCHYMVETAEADVVCPAVAAEDPDRLLREVILLGEDLRSYRASGRCRFLELDNESVGSRAVCVAVV